MWCRCRPSATELIWNCFGAGIPSRFTGGNWWKFCVTNPGRSKQIFSCTWESTSRMRRTGVWYLVSASILNLVRIGQESDAKTNLRLKMAMAWTWIKRVSSENPCVEKVQRLEVQTIPYQANIQGAWKPLSVDLPVTYTCRCNYTTRTGVDREIGGFRMKQMANS